MEVDRVVDVGVVVSVDVVVGVDLETGVGVNRGVVLDETMAKVGTGVSLSGDADLFSKTVSDVDRFVSAVSDRVVAKTGEIVTEKIEIKIASTTP